MEGTLDSPARTSGGGDIYLPRPATLLSVSAMTASDAFFELALDGPEDLGHLPGQFVEVSVPGMGEAPISVCSSPTRKGSFQMLVRRIGSVTQALHRKSPGDKVGIRGPFGTSFPMEGELKGKNLLFVAGGIGLAPLRSAIQYALDRRGDFGRIAILAGTRSAAERLFTGELLEWKRRNDLTLLETVDQPSPGWAGQVGLITGLFGMLRLEPGPWAALVCGPPVMYRFVLRELRRLQVPSREVHVSLERRMKCGVGKCGHCQINGLYVCQQGPVFRAGDLFDLKEAL